MGGRQGMGGHAGRPHRGKDRRRADAAPHSGQRAMQAHFIARDRDVDLPRHFSLGFFIFVRAVRWAIERGIIQFLEMSYSSTEYKQLLGAVAHQRWELYLAPSPLSCMLFIA